MSPAYHQYVRLFVNQLKNPTNMLKNLHFILLAVCAAFLISCSDDEDILPGGEDIIETVGNTDRPKDNSGIQVFSDNRYYWQYDGIPLLLLGGAKEDNIFNFQEGLVQYLDQLEANGGNYIKNIMSSRTPGNVYPFLKTADGLYDLNQWNPEYWDRLDRFLGLCAERDIVVQLIIWDLWDYFMTDASLGFGENNKGWESNPFNPALNVNYTATETGLATTINYHPTARPSNHKFFKTVPNLENIAMVRNYQEAFVKKIMDTSLPYKNILYCINNDMGEDMEWSKYWSSFIRNEATKIQKKIYITDMHRSSNLGSTEQNAILTDRNHFDFFEASQNNLNSGDEHYGRIISARNRVRDNAVPFNNSKIYGGVEGFAGGVDESIQRYWKTIFAGSAATNFHKEGPRPNAFSLGFNEQGRAQIKHMRMFADAMNSFSPAPTNNLLSNRSENEAFCLSHQNNQYAVYFPNGGNVTLNLKQANGSYIMRWFDIVNGTWSAETEVQGARDIELTTPGTGHWAVLLKRKI